MANKSNTRHIKRLNAPRFFNIHRKQHVYVVKPNPGRHSLKSCVPLSLAVQKLELAQNASDARQIIKSGAVLVNNTKVKEPKYPVGINDIIEVPSAAKCFSIGIDASGRITFESLKKADYNALTYKVVGKFKAPKGTIMLRLHDGSMMKGSNDIKVNDSVVTDQKKTTIERIGMQPDARCKVIDGAHVGSRGTIGEIKQGSIKRHASVVIKSDEGESFETLVKNIMVIR